MFKKRKTKRNVEDGMGKRDIKKWRKKKREKRGNRFHLHLHPSPSASRDRGLGTLELWDLCPRFGVEGIRLGRIFVGFVGSGGIGGLFSLLSLVPAQLPFTWDTPFAWSFLDRSPSARTVKSSSRSSSLAAFKRSVEPLSFFR